MFGFEGDFESLSSIAAQEAEKVGGKTLAFIWGSTKPDRDKIISFANLLKTLPYPEIKDVALKSNLNVAKQKINNITDELLSAVAKVLTNNL